MMKGLLKFVITVAIVLNGIISIAQPALRGIYVNGFSSILGNTVKEDSLLHYAQDSSFNYLALYDLSSFNLNNSTTANLLASFMNRAKTNFGIQYFGACGETFNFFQNKIIPYNNGRTNANEKFDVLNVEFEFWTTASVNPGGYYCVNYLQPEGCNCDTAGAFGFYKTLLRKVDSLANNNSMLSETYVGWFNTGQAQQYSGLIDRILVHAYRIDASSVWAYSKPRLGYLASNNVTLQIVPIFSSEPAFMGPWLTNGHGKNEAYDKYLTDYNNDNSAWKQYINLVGYQWFAYGYMPKPTPSFNANISASGPTTFCQGETVTLTATQGTTYNWNNGATTQSITVNNSGSFHCTVTYNGLTSTTSSTTVTVRNRPTTSIVAAAPNAGVSELTSTNSAGSGTISNYQWFLDGAAISGATSADYSAYYNGDYFLRVTNSNNCSTNSNTENVFLPPNCALTIPGQLATSNITGNSVRIEWQIPNAVDSIVIRLQKDGSSVYTYYRIHYTGQNYFNITSGIHPNTSYNWRILAKCGNLASNYSSQQNFTSGNFAVYHVDTNQYVQRIQDYFQVLSYDLSDIHLTTYPNPASEIFTLSFNSGIETLGSIIVTDVNGKMITSEKLNIIEGENTIQLDAHSWTKGIYNASLLVNDINIGKKVAIMR